MNRQAFNRHLLLTNLPNEQFKNTPEGGSSAESERGRH
jgi:hypothetical protein